MKKERRPADHRSKHPCPSESDSSTRLTFVHMRDILRLSFLALFVFLIYSNTLTGPFVFDDLPNILDNPHIRLTKLTLKDITRAGFASPSPNRPVANISFALNYYVHQYAIGGYHVVNILIHIATGILLYLLVMTTLSLPPLRYRKEPHRWIPFMAVLIWLVHPIQTQSVTYIVQRMNSMAAMFYILSLLLYAQARLTEGRWKQWALFAGCILAGIVSFGTKEIAATLPFFIFLYEWYFFQELNWTWLKRHLVLFVGIVLFVAALAFLYLGAHPLERILMTYGALDFTLTQRVMSQFRVVVFYISLLIFPHPSRLILDHDFPLSHSLLDPITTVLSMGAIVGLIGLAIYMAKKERLLSFCILWFFGNLVIESSVIGLEIVFEHRTYLPSMLVSLVAVTVAHRFIKRTWLGVAILCIVVMVFSVWAYERNSTWADGVTLWRDCAEKSPKKARPHYNLGNALVQQGKFADAIEHYTEALRITPGAAETHNNLGNALASQERFEEAITHLSEAIRLTPDYAAAHYNLGNALVQQGKFADAIEHYTEALRITPDFGVAHYNLGNALVQQGKFADAIEHYTEALRINPDDTRAKGKLAVLLAGPAKKGDTHKK